MGREKPTKTQLLPTWLLLCWISINIVCTGGQKTYGIHGIAPANTTLMFPSENVLKCAALCVQKACTNFHQLGDKCHIGGVGLGIGTSTQLYNRKYPCEVLPSNLPVLASSEYPRYYGNYGPDQAVDGDYGTWFSSGINDFPSWWRLDIGSVRYVHRIDITPRCYDDCNYFQDIEIRVGATDISNGNFTSWPLFAHYRGPYSAAQGLLVFTSELGIPGRYLSILRGKDVTFGNLKIMELVVCVRLLNAP